MNFCIISHSSTKIYYVEFTIFKQIYTHVELVNVKFISGVNMGYLVLVSLRFALLSGAPQSRF